MALSDALGIKNEGAFSIDSFSNRYQLALEYFMLSIMIEDKSAPS